MYRRIRRAFFTKQAKVITIVGLILLVLGIAKAILIARRFMLETGLTVSTISNLVFDGGKTLKNNNGRTNILLLGIAGGDHEGADLTDTMLIVSLHVATRAVAFISVPRDIWSDTLRDKVNSAYHYGEVKKKGGGMTLAKATIEDITGLPIHYTFVIDFSGFKKVIDLVGGVALNVPQAFTDPDYPIAGKENDTCEGDPQFRCRYEDLRFEAGAQMMDGERALKYVRSRHAEGDEGTDFARSRRQQDVLVALKQKLSKFSAWTSLDHDRQLLGAFDDATNTDMNLGELLTVGKFMVKIFPEYIQKISFDSLLTAPPLWLYHRYVLMPKENFEAIHNYLLGKLK